MFTVVMQSVGSCRFSAIRTCRYILKLDIAGTFLAVRPNQQPLRKYYDQLILF